MSHDYESNIETKFSLVLEFLRANPDSLSGNAPKLGADNSPASNVRLFERFQRERLQISKLKTPKTFPDPAVSAILKAVCNYENGKLEEIKYEHQMSMAAENVVGELLEKYIASEAEKKGWIWCSGNFVKAIDFIKKESDGSWTTLQIKNRDNSENSSSSAIRLGTEIKHWFRTFSRRSLSRGECYTNWENFPDEELKTLLNEEGFLEFAMQNIGKEGS